MTEYTTRRRRRGKVDRPEKPYKDFPLYGHPSGNWAKKIRGRLHYFGRWGRIRNGKMERLPDAGWKEALELYKVQADDLHAGRTPRKAKPGELTLMDLANAFLTAKRRRLEAGEIGKRMEDEYRAITDLLLAEFGRDRLVVDLAADDFERLRALMAKRWGPVRLSNAVTRVRSVFKYAHESGLVEQPVRFGPEFEKPSASVLRKHRAENGGRMLTADECRRLVGAAPVQLKAMVLLGLNAGFGAHDCALLPLTALDIDAGWINYPRPKTGIPRRCPLWPETVKALRVVINERPEPKGEEAERLVFVTTRGRQWLSRDTANPVAVASRNLMKTVGIHRPGIGHYTLRHVHRTVADGARDQVAANAIMGHSDHSMAAVYREHIDDSRLRAVVECVREWLWPSKEKPKGLTPEGTAKSKRPRKPATRAKVKDKPKSVAGERPMLRIVG